MIGRSMKKRGNFIERSTRYGRTIRSIGRVKKCASVNVPSLSISSIRSNTASMTSRKRLFFQLALRVGNEKDEDEADTVGCCSLRIEHIKLYDSFDGVGDNVVEFDFLGKDSIRSDPLTPHSRPHSPLGLDTPTKSVSKHVYIRMSNCSWRTKRTLMISSIVSR